MTREEYLIKKQNREIDINEAFEFYINADSTSDKVSFQQFTQYFPIYINSGGTLEKFYRYFDKKYNVLTLHDINGTKYF